jgi:hypothetical protein
MNKTIERFFIGFFVLALAVTLGGLDAPKLTADAHEITPPTVVIKTKPKLMINYDYLETEIPTYKINHQLSPHELKNLLYSVGFRNESLKQAWAIVMKESTAKPMAHNKNSKTGDNSYGLFQINMIGKLGPERLKEYGLTSNEELFDPLTNAKIAYKLSKRGNDWGPWHGITKKTIEWMQKYPG